MRNFCVVSILLNIFFIKGYNLAKDETWSGAAICISWRMEPLLLLLYSSPSWLPQSSSPSLLYMATMSTYTQCGAVKTRSIFSKLFTKHTPWGVFLWIQHLIDILPALLQSSMRYIILLDRCIMTLDCIDPYMYMRYMTIGDGIHIQHNA